MRLGVSYNVFDAEELLEPSILAIRGEVDHISVVYQEISNSGVACSFSLLPTLESLKKRKLIDTLHRYKPAVSKGCLYNEVKKRNIGLSIAKRHFCTHFLSMDSDEFYEKKAFAQAKKYIESHGFDATAVQVVNYFKTPRNRMVYREGVYYVSFIYKVKWGKRFNINANFPVLVDPTRRMEAKRFYCFDASELVMDHMTLVRRDIRSKLVNSSAGALYFDNGIDRYVQYFEGWTPGQPAYPPSNHSNIVSLKTVDDRYGIERFL